MSIDHILKIIQSKPGIARDGTDFDKDEYIDGQWVRFYLEKPKKIGGYSLTDAGTGEIVRNMFAVQQQNSVDIYLGRPSSLNVFNLTEDGFAGGEYNRTPSGFIANPNNQWTFDLYTVLSEPSGVAIVLPNGPVATTMGSGIVTLTITSNPNLKTGDVLVFYGLTTFEGITAAQLNIAATITVTNSTTITYQSAGSASGTSTGGGGNAGTYMTTDAVTYIIAVAPPNSNDINNQTEALVYAGDVSLTNPLVPISASNPQCSGGIIVLSAGAAGVYLMKYGNNGVITFLSDPFGDWSDAVTVAITGTKIIKGLRTRGGSNSPAALFWSLNSLIRCTYVGGDTVFQFDTIQDDITLLSPNCICTYSNVYFWIGQNEFYMYNGVVRQIKNNFNTDYFFNNFNRDNSNKIWGMVLNKYKEVWWFYPKGSSTECNAVLILHYDEQNFMPNFWFDSVISRSAGIPPNSTFDFPLMSDSMRSINPIVPVTSTVVLAANPINTNNGSLVVYLTVPSTVGIQNGDTITVSSLENSGGAVGGIPVANLNITAPVTIISPTVLSYQATAIATSSANGGSITATLGNNPLTTDGSTATVVVAIASTTGIFVGQNIIMAGANATVGGITAAHLNVQSVITAVVTNTSFSYTAATVSTTGVGSPGGGAAVTYTTLGTFTYVSNLTYPVWIHEKGTDKVAYGQNLAIDSYFETNLMAYFEQDPKSDRQMRIRRIEPDFVMSGTMTVVVNSRDFAQGTITSSTPYIFVPGQTIVTLAKIDMINMGRLVSFRFESNIAGGNYQMGKLLLNYAPGDVYP